MRVPSGRKPESANLLVATAIDAVRFNMSTAPRPHTSPSTSSPPNGSRSQPSGFTGTTSVWPISRRRGVRGPRRRARGGRGPPPLGGGGGVGPPGLRLVGLDVDRRALEEALERV